MPADETQRPGESLEEIAAALQRRLAKAAQNVNDLRPAALLAGALRDVRTTIAASAAAAPGTNVLDDETQEALASLIEHAGVVVGPGHDLRDVLAAVEEVYVAQDAHDRRNEENLREALKFVADLRFGWLAADGPVAERFVARANALFVMVGVDPEEVRG